MHAATQLTTLPRLRVSYGLQKVQKLDDRSLRAALYDIVSFFPMNKTFQ